MVQQRERRFTVNWVACRGVGRGWAGGGLGVGWGGVGGHGSPNGTACPVWGNYDRRFTVTWVTWERLWARETLAALVLSLPVWLPRLSR